MSPLLSIAIEAAKRGAKTAQDFEKNKLQTTYKPDKSPVTKADIASENTIKAFISSRVPKAQFMAEETDNAVKYDEFWVIDPIDGTSSFMKGLPFWFVLISYYKHNEIEFGVCFFPLLNQVMYAEKTKGAFLDDLQIHVSKTDKLDEALISFSSLNRFSNKNYLPGLLQLVSKSSLARSPEPTVSSYFLAQGKYDVLIDINAKAWDTAPLKIIIEEAGGKVTNMHGHDWQITDKGFIAANGLLHDEVVKIINS